MKATQAFDQVTGGRPLSAKLYEWITDLAERFGDDAVAEAIEVEGPAGSFDKLLGRVRDRLAKQAQHRRGEAPAELSGRDMLAIARGDMAEPERPYTYDTRDLTLEEYGQLLAWRGGRAPEPPAAEAAEDGRALWA